ncbi:MAG TPA: ribonuclease HII [Thermoanaerobaculia bacterium]|nr:ribonuclease HII [Thermoanaerobaculia bacterium]
MAEFVAQSSTTFAISAGKPHASKRSGRAKPAQPARARSSSDRAAGSFYLERFFAELARIAEMSEVERRLGEFGFRLIAGTDEVGRGCLAGPVVAAAVVLDQSNLFGVNDSKVVSHTDRKSLCELILRNARGVAIGVIEPETIDRINILQASKLAMREAVENLPCRPDVLLLDAVVVEKLELPQLPLIHGDRRSVSIAAASIVAKVYRDLLMESYHARYPLYDFINNRGYGTEEHWKALRKHGPTPIHRKSFEGVTEPLLLFARKQGNGGPAR